jgi:hypothetical protein
MILTIGSGSGSSAGRIPLLIRVAAQMKKAAEAAFLPVA